MNFLFPRGALRAGGAPPCLPPNSYNMETRRWMDELNWSDSGEYYWTADGDITTRGGDEDPPSILSKEGLLEIMILKHVR